VVEGERRAVILALVAVISFGFAVSGHRSATTIVFSQAETATAAIQIKFSKVMETSALNIERRVFSKMLSQRISTANRLQR
jgi:hypothetical protein